MRKAYHTFIGYKKSKINKLWQRTTALLLAFVMLLTINPSVLSFFSFEAQAAETEAPFGVNSLDGSKGNPAEEWLSLSDARYQSYGPSATLGAKATPYLIKTSDELYALALSVNKGNSFQNKYIDVTGLQTQEELDAVNSVYATANVIDLRVYNGTAQSATGTNLWVPIGMQASAPFAGNLYSSTGVSIINLTYNYSAAHPYTGTAYGLFGYNSGTIGVYGKEMSVSLTTIETEQGMTKEFNFTANADKITAVGGVAAYNNAGAKIANINWGIGTYFDRGKMQAVPNYVMNNKILLRKNTGAALTVGGIAGSNLGTVENCTFRGTINSQGETGTGTSFSQQNGIGGIAGYNTGLLTSCVSQANINIDAVGSFIKIGGIAGCSYAASVNSNYGITRSVFAGSIKAAVPFANNTEQASAGGITGVAVNQAITQCIVTADIDFFAAGTDDAQNAQKNKYDTGRVGGLAGTTTGAAQVTGCFATGIVRGGTYVGGLIGARLDTSALSGSYFTGAVKGDAYVNGSEEHLPGYNVKLANSGGSNTEYVDQRMVGGLVGRNDSTGSLDSCYYAGSTLNSNTGSLFGNKASGTNIYYDKQVSPNCALASDAATVSYGKSTDDLKTVSLTGFAAGTQNNYPQLSWISALDNTTEFNKLLKALSILSTDIGLKVNASNAFADKGEYSAYQLQAGYLGTNAFTGASSPDDAALGISRGAWKQTAQYTGQNTGETVGVLCENTSAVQNLKYNVSVSVTRKLCKAVNQSGANANEITDSVSFMRLVDLSNTAAGAVCGAKFTLGKDIGDITVKSFADPEASELRMVNNLFCAEIDGASHKIQSVTLGDGFVSIFRMGMYAKIHDITFTGVNIGSPSDTTAIEQGDQYAGLLFSQCKESSFENLSFENVTIHAQSTADNNYFGLLAGQMVTAGNIIRGITVSNADVTLPQVSSIYYGLLSASVGRSAIIDGITVDQYKLRAGSQKKGTPRALGGLFGQVDDDNTKEAGMGIVANCTIKNLDAVIDCYQYVSQVGFGGIGSRLFGNVENCHVTGKIVGPVDNGNANQTTSLVAGISPFGNNGKKISNSSFRGELDGYNAAGLVAYTNYGFRVENCTVIATINADTESRSGYMQDAGGLVARISNGGNTIINSYFMGSVTASNAGGLVGNCTSSLTLTTSYAKAIVNSNLSTGSAGGLAGNVSGDLTAGNCYFAGQLNGAGSKGGISGKGTVNSVSRITNTYFDINIAGETIPSISSVTLTDKELGAQLDAKCAKTTAQIVKSALNGSYVNESSTNYPQLSVYANGSQKQKDESGISTQKVFQARGAKAFLTSTPDFDLQENSAYTVDRNTQQTSVLSPWDTILKYTASGAQPYGYYSMKEKGNTTFTVKYKDIPVGKSLNMVYNINVKPFDYGSGTESDPYIIYNNRELLKFHDYLNNGFDSAIQYYKIGSVENGVVVGDPITLDLSEYDDWSPIINLAGHLDGNNSLIRNIKCSSGYIKYNEDNTSVIATYFGFFGSSTNTGSVTDLTLDRVSITPKQGTVSAKIGAFMGQSSGGIYSNIVVTNASVKTSGLSAPHMGGLIGNASLGLSTFLDLSNCAVYAEIENNNTSGYAGGLIGTLDGGDTSNVTLSGCASYGYIKGSQNLGGLVGRVDGPNISARSCVSTMDLVTEVTNGFVGGLIGQCNSQNITFTLKDSLYGGRIEADVDSNKIGGLVGQSKIYDNFVSYYTFGNEADISFLAAELTPHTGFSTDEDIKKYILKKVSDRIDGCYFNANVNPYTTTTPVYSARFSYLNDKGLSAFKDLIYSEDIGILEFGKSNTYKMTLGTLPLTGAWTLEDGYYPRPLWLKNEVSDVGTGRDEQYVNDVSRFYSLAVYYTNAGKFGDHGYSNLFFMATDVNWAGYQSNAQLKITQNNRMLLSTGEGNATPVTVNAVYHNKNAFSRIINYTPSVIPCSVPDYSFYFANPQGMWITSKEDNGTQTSYPWTLYTADQLQGLNNLITNIADGNGLEISASGPEYQVSPPTDTQLGDTFVLGADIDFMEAYPSFTPIGSSNFPFNTSFNGRGYTIANLHLNSGYSDTAEKVIGLFGYAQNAEISNTGIVSGEVKVDASITYAGSFVGGMLGNTSLVSCFSAVPVIGKGRPLSGTVAGGLTGYSSGAANSVLSSFFTGFIYLEGTQDSAGGIAGRAESLAVSDSYVAGYISAEKNNGVVFAMEQNSRAENTYYDIGACGEMKNSSGAISKMPTAALLNGNVFGTAGYCYPIPKSFLEHALTDAATAAILPVDLTNARSVTSGKVSQGAVQTYHAQMRYLTDYQGMTSKGSVGTDGKEYDGNTPFTSFEKIKTGLVFLSVNTNGHKRVLLANLQCWYDAGLDNKVFTINSAKELAEFAAIVNGEALTADNNPNGRHEHTNITNPSFDGWTVRLGSNIDLSVFENWTPAGNTKNPFKGTFDGKGYVISNLSVKQANTDGYAALFGTVQGASLINLGLSGGAVSTAAASAALVGNALSSQIKACFTNVTVSGGSKTGGIAVDLGAGSSISQCYNMGMLSGTGKVAGIAVSSAGSIKDCYNVGVVSQSADAAGITVDNGGTIEACYQASYLQGERVYPIAPFGTVTGCFFDGKMLSYSGTVANVSDGIRIADSDIWQAQTASKYPELKCFIEADTNVMQDASALSVIKLDFGSGCYNEFVQAKANNFITTNGVKTDIELTNESNIFSVWKDGDFWLVEPAKTGPNYLTASVNSSVPIRHDYSLVAVMTMKIRYRFDFSQLFAGHPNANPDYNGQGSTVTSTWTDENQSVYTISTAQDLISFANYVNAGKLTKGKKFLLNSSINMTDITLPVIGSREKPFEGNFDGGGYTISNLSMSGSGNVALFGAIESGAKVHNFLLSRFRVTAAKTSSDMYIACIAALNKGTIVNVGITDGILTANNATSSQNTYLGVFAAENLGKIRGCYFIQDRDTPYGIVHYSQSNQFVGGMVGNNAGMLTGCYLISNMFTANIKAIAGSNQGKQDTITNCYFNVMGTAEPVNLRYAFDETAISNYFVPEPQMKTKEFAKWLSSNLYAGTYECGTLGELIGSSDGTVINNGLPYLTSVELAKYDISSYFANENSMMLSIWNLEEGGNSSFLNGIFALDDLDFKYFKSIITHQSIRFDMSLLPSDIGYEISSRVYGVQSQFNQDVDQSGNLISSGKNVKDSVDSADCEAYAIDMNQLVVQEPNLIVVNVSFKNISGSLPWGVYRTWSAT